MVPLLVTESQDDLLQETERLVNVGGLFEYKTCTFSLLGAFTTSQINEMELGVGNFVSGFNARSALNMKREDGVSTR